MSAQTFYRSYAKQLIKQLRVEREITYKELSRRLLACGVRIDPQALTNKINRGAYSWTFALQILSAMGVEHVSVPKPPRHK